MSTAEIARSLHLVPGTVKCHLTRISAKIGTRDRVQTVVWAYANGVLPLTSSPPDTAAAHREPTARPRGPGGSTTRSA